MSQQYVSDLEFKNSRTKIQGTLLIGHTIDMFFLLQYAALYCGKKTNFQ